MNVIFLTMSRITRVADRGIYQDLLRKFRDEGHSLYIVTPYERSLRKHTEFFEQEGVYILGVKTLNLQKSSVIEKGVGQILVEGQYLSAIKRYLSEVHFDLILYSTPPITFYKVIKYLKENNKNSTSYLLLKDIFPQNAVDLCMMATTGLKGILYKYFRRKEEKLYSVSDYIGCMSPENVRYVLAHNPELDIKKVEVAPNSIDISRVTEIACEEKNFIKEKYGLPLDKPIFIYGGNLGKPQSIKYLIACLQDNANRKDCHFVIVGSGTEFPTLQEWYTNQDWGNVTVMNSLPSADYDRLVKACDVGMIFLDHRFTIPNYPSRLLSYIENKMPVICATDPNTDIGRIAESNGFGFWCESNSVDSFTEILDKMIHSDCVSMGERGYKFLMENYLVDNTYNVIMSHF